MTKKIVQFLSGKTIEIDINETGMFCHEITNRILEEYEKLFGESLRKHRANIIFNNKNCNNYDNYDYLIFFTPPQKMFTEEKDEFIYILNHEFDVLDSIDYLRENVEKSENQTKQLTIKMQQSVFDHKGLNHLDPKMFKMFLQTINEWYIINSLTFFPKGLRHSNIPEFLSCCKNLETLVINFYLDPTVLIDLPLLKHYEIRKEGFLSVSKEWLKKISDTTIKFIIIEKHFPSELFQENKGFYVNEKIWSYEKYEGIEENEYRSHLLYLTRI